MALSGRFTLSAEAETGLIPKKHLCPHIRLLALGGISGGDGGELGSNKI
jgi:hypothetical protein